MRLTTILAALLSATITTAWEDNCKGSLRTLRMNECTWAFATIDDKASYPPGTEFSRMECFLKYRAGPGPDGIHNYNPEGFNINLNLTGAAIRKVAQSILWYCPEHKGSWATGNCETCRVTVNYRDQTCARVFHIAAGTRWWPFRKPYEDV